MTDSLSLLAFQGGLITAPSSEQAAEASGDLCTEQRLMRTGDPLPIVFCRREGDVGGCLVSPAATEARFSNDASNVLTASWHLVIGEGPMDPIQARDVFQCACRVGSSTQAFGRRAGSWQPGNLTVDRGSGFTRWEVPRFCGAAGTYEGLATLSFVNTYQDGEEFNRQIHAFSRGGRYVHRLLDGVMGPSSNVVDLYLYLLRAVERLPESMINLASLRHAARFTELLGMRWDGVLGREATENLDDWCENVLKPFFLLARTRVSGQEGLMPMLPTNLDGSLFLSPVAAHATLTEVELDLETWNLEFLSLSDRRPICAQMQWRQQGEGIQSLARTSEVRLAPPFNAPDGPFEQHDLSRFATSERHAVKIGAYVVAHRALSTHTLEVSARPGPYNQTLSDGSIVRVKVPLVVDGEDLGTHDYLYRVSSIGKDLMGETQLSLVHLPLDSLGRSAISWAVYQAQPTGTVLPFNPTGPTCDVNSSSNQTPLPVDTIDWNLPTDNPYDVEIPLGNIPPLDPLDGPINSPMDVGPLDGPGGPLDGPAGPPPEPPSGPDLPPMDPPPDSPPNEDSPNEDSSDSPKEDSPDKPPPTTSTTDPARPPGTPAGPPNSPIYNFSDGPNVSIRISWRVLYTITPGANCGQTIRPGSVTETEDKGRRSVTVKGKSVIPLFLIRKEERVCSNDQYNLPYQFERRFMGWAIHGLDASGQHVLLRTVGGEGWHGKATAASYYTFIEEWVDVTIERV